MTAENPKKINPDSLRALRKILFSSGVLFFGIGSLLFVKPDLAADIIPAEQIDTKILASIFMFVGLMDFILARFLLNKADKK